MGALRVGLLLGLLRAACAQECPKNPISGIACSADHASRDSTGFVRLSGTCDPNGKCVCSSDFSGSACDVPVYSYAKRVILNNWVYLAKSCWSGSTGGTVGVTITWIPWSCGKFGCAPITNATNIPLPYILFYSSYDQAFSKAVLSSYTTLSSNTQSTETPPCQGSNSVFKEPIYCTQSEDAGVNGTVCTFSKEYSLTNSGTSGTLVYIALGGCGMVGTIDWSIRVRLSNGNLAGVCGARGARFTERCYSDSGGTCAVQQLSKVLTSIQPPARLGKVEQAVIAALFVVIFAAAVVGVKIYQSMHKKARAKKLLGRMGLPATHGLAAAGGEYDEAGGVMGDGAELGAAGQTQQTFVLTRAGADHPAISSAVYR